MSKGEQDRLRGLDGLRAVAILLVIAHHLHFTRWQEAPYWLHAILREGKAGVTVFFVLSGFLITWLLLKEEKKTGSTNLLGFCYRRGFRILPAATFYLLAMAVLTALGYLQLPPIDFLYCTFFLRNMVHHDMTLYATGHYWSLSIEEQFYLVWPLVFMLTRGRRRLVLALVLIAMAPLWRSLCYRMGWGVSYPRTDLRYDCLLMGCVLAMLRANKDGAAILRGRMFQHPAILLVLLPTLGFLLFYYEFVPSFLRWSIFSASFACIALLINYLVEDHADVFSWLMNTPPIAWIGRMSYSLYLWQQIFCMGVEPHFAWMRTLPLALVLSLACSMVSYYGVEQPFLRWRERLDRRRKARVEAPAELCPVAVS